MNFTVEKAEQKTRCRKNNPFDQVSRQVRGDGQFSPATLDNPFNN